MRINDWLALEKKYKFRFPEDFFPLYRELERTRVISDWKSDGLEDYLELLNPESLEDWWGHAVDPDLMPIIGTPTMGAICLRLPFGPDEPAMWVERDQETNFRASLGRSFAGVVRMLAAYMDAWSFDCTKNGEMDGANALFQRSRRVLTEIRGLMDAKERQQLVHLRFWPLPHGTSPITRNPKIVVPTFTTINGVLSQIENIPRWAQQAFVSALTEDASFGAGHWALGAMYALQWRTAEACREWSLLMEGDLRTACPTVDCNYASAYGRPPVANFPFAARYLRSHEAEYRSCSSNPAVASILLGDGFNTEAAWLEGLRNAMENGWYDEALPVAQSLLASYSDDEWFNDDVDTDLCFGTCTNALATIYAAAGFECRVTGAQK